MSFRAFPTSIVLAALCLTSCASKRSELLLDTRVTPPEVVLAMVDAKEKKIQTMVGTGSLTFESPEIAGTAAFESSLRKPDSLLVTLEGPFGIDVGTFFLSRDRYVMYNSLENSVITGNPSQSAIRSVIPFDLTTEQILNAFSGVISIPFSNGSLISYSIDDDLFFLSFTCGVGTCNYWIDSRYLLVAKYEMRDAMDRVIVEATSSWFTEEDDLSAAKRIVVKFPLQNRRLAISYASVSFNVPNPRFDFSIPPNARSFER